MRVMVIVKATEDSEKGFVRTPETMAMMEAMGKFNQELTKAGIMRAGDGLQPTSKGKRVAFKGAQPHGHRRAVRRDQGADRRLLALGGQGHGRGGRPGEALPQSHAGPERDRNPAAVRDGGFSMEILRPGVSRR